MNGKILLDTNAIIYALNDGLLLPSADYSLSIITEMELFSYSKLTIIEEENIIKMLNYFKIYTLSQEIKVMTIKIRKEYGIKLPDSIICATAIINNATLISNDKQLSKITSLNILTLDELIKIS